MAVKVRDLGKSGQRFEQRAAMAVPEYVDGVQGATDWEAKTVASQQTYEQGVQASIGKKSFSKGVRKAGNAKYQERATKKGAQRYPTGVAGAGSDWQRGWQPYGDAISALNLPPRGPRRSPQNRQRINAVLDVIVAVKEKELTQG
jgi:hypothetical protein